jgi:hypothetical protein
MSAPKAAKGGVEGLEFWQGGDVRSHNIGPAGGSRFLGKVGKPGLYFFVAPNTGGKSHHLRLLGKLQRERLLRTDSDITDGADAAYLEFALARVLFRRTPTGEVLEPERSGIETLPTIEALPSAIQTLIDGDNVGDPEARARHRLEALLSYAPVPSDEAAVAALCQALDERAFEEDPGAELRELWARMVADLAAKNKRLRLEPFRTSADFRSWLLEQPRESVLEDHDRLLDLLNGTANTAEKLAALQGEIAAKADGVVRGAVEAAARRLGVSIEDADAVAALEVDLRARAGQPPPTAADLSRARMALARLEGERGAAESEKERRQALAASHGPRPDISAARQRMDDARIEIDLASDAVRQASRDQAAAKAVVDELTPRAVKAVMRVAAARESWMGRSAALEGLFTGPAAVAGAGAPQIAVPLDRRVAASAADGVRLALDELMESAELARVELERTQEAGAKEGAARTEEERSVRRHGAAAEALRTADQELTTALASVETWERTAELIAAEVPGPTPESIAAATTEVEALERDAELAAAAADYHAAAIRRDAEATARLWLETVGEDLRAAAKASWARLGAIVTEALDLPWLMVSGLQILLVYDGAGEGARLAATKEDGKDIRILDDSSRVSTAELHEAVLKVMLSRREKLGGILVVPDATLHPLDEERLAVFSGWARDAGLWVFSERPRRAGDPEELTLAYVEPLEAAA